MLQKIVQQVREIENEVRKVTFPKREETTQTAIAVVSFTLIVTSILGVVDFIFSRIFKFLF